MQPLSDPATVRVKICGITTDDDARAAIDSGADALGFNGWPGSKRYIDPLREAPWIAQLPPLVSRVAVLVDPSREEITAILATGAFHCIQLHGDESPERVAALVADGISVIKALRIGALPTEASPQWAAQSVLLDAAVDGQVGGTGVRVDTGLLKAWMHALDPVPVVVAGGLTPENVAGTVASTRPYAVDVASGVEDSPRRKSLAKMRAFVEAAKSA